MRPGDDHAVLGQDVTRRGERDVAAAPVPVEPGQQELTFTVTVTFALD